MDLVGWVVAVGEQLSLAGHLEKTIVSDNVQSGAKKK
jgi:hypothetical protein